MWETWKAHHKTRNTYFKFEPESVTQSRCTSLVEDLESFRNKTYGLIVIQWLVKHMVYMVQSTRGMHRHHVNGWIEKEKQGMRPGFFVEWVSCVTNLLVYKLYKKFYIHRQTHKYIEIHRN